MWLLMFHDCGKKHVTLTGEQCLFLTFGWHTCFVGLANFAYDIDVLLQPSEVYTKIARDHLGFVDCGSVHVFY